MGYSGILTHIFLGLKAPTRCGTCIEPYIMIHQDTSRYIPIAWWCYIGGYSKNWPGFIGEFFSKSPPDSPGMSGRYRPNGPMSRNLDVLGLPSGNLTVCYWKWPSRNSGFSHEKHGGSFHSYVNVCQRVPGAWCRESESSQKSAQMHNFSQPLISWGYHPKMGMTFSASRIVKLHCSRVNVHVCLD